MRALLAGLQRLTASSSLRGVSISSTRQPCSQVVGVATHGHAHVRHAVALAWRSTTPVRHRRIPGGQSTTDSGSTEPPSTSGSDCFKQPR